MRILVVDDNEDSVFLLKTWLEEIDFLGTVEHKVTSQEALSMRRQPFDLIFLDLHLKGSTHNNPYPLLKSKYPKSLIVVFTALELSGNESFYKARGFPPDIMTLEKKESPLLELRSILRKAEKMRSSQD